MQGDDFVEELGSVATDQGAQFLFDAQLKRIVDRTGMNGIDPDIAPGQFLGQYAYQSDLGMLCGDLAVDAGIAGHAGDA